METKKIEFEGSTGEKLSAKIDLPKSETKAYALFAHCFTCSKDLKAVGNITKALADIGIATFRFDFTGLGQSEGDFADTNFSSNVDDLVKAYEYMDKEFSAPAILIGHSLGGAAVLQASHKMESVKAVATIAAPAEPAHVKENFEMSLDEINEKGEAKVSLAGRPFTIKKQFIDDLEEARMKKFIHNLGKALIVFHSPIDNTVGIDNASKIFVAAKHPKSFISLDKADHLLSEKEDSMYIGKVLGTWAEKYI
ncbi:MAG TPA: osmotically inducible protein OsmC [Balneola sp.]|jgi:alpha/beta superfamily hydrolase|nr:osmotically inducible protein OsmC [Bacteroidota bacterium]MAC06454.1 osmotically inducible protein OsmC [Balneola sp.]MAO78648.1 osmotically inducible protein OsmC [Balneola sp.]MBF63124.1 osmotically inducible protein OsmC [Balneola sp.]HAH49921.1 osmotically inducible protein OsmC [Balneola sp.]|tara:strand:- start:11732 stop:12487 length:756 start_codon:yes stop_codon:yes gene_type:complete